MTNKFLRAAPFTRNPRVTMVTHLVNRLIQRFVNDFNELGSYMNRYSSPIIRGMIDVGKLSHLLTDGLMRWLRGQCDFVAGRIPFVPCELLLISRPGGLDCETITSRSHSILVGYPPYMRNYCVSTATNI